MKKNILICITIGTIFSFNIYSQKTKLTRADKNYATYSYVDAIKTYERVAEKGYKSVDLFKKLGNSYYFISELNKAAKWYGELFAMDTINLEPEYYYRYAQSLKSIGQNDKADEKLELFNQKSAYDIRGKIFKKNTNYLEILKANSGRYMVEDAGINSKYSDYGTAIYMNKIVFASARNTGSIGQKKHKWNNQYFTNLYTADLGENMTPNVPEKFDNNVNSKFNESTPIFTSDGKTMYFTRNNYLDGKKGKDGNDITLIKIYKANLENDKWVNITELPFDGDNYSTAHPALSPDGKTLYFASDMPGTIGQSDLFKVKINDNGSFGIPENLGNKINTEGRETFPFISDENEIYYATDGHPGFGGLDIFMSKINADGTFSEVLNVGADVNSPKDDFAYLIDTKSRRGFFTSNRDGGQGYDDIYKFLETKKLISKQLLYGEISDLTTAALIPNAKSNLYDNQFNLLDTTTSDDKGNYSFMIECGKTYIVRAEKPEYTTKEQKITIVAEKEKTYLPIIIEKAKWKITVGDDLGKCFGIKMIYFDLDKSNIRTEAALDLEKILDVLNQNSTMKLDIRSHTDSRANFRYNKTLSDNRAKATISWLIKNGIDSSRLIGKGYGETHLLNKCIDCTEDEHQFNRRSEFIITAL
ncbi:OmpA family protein [Flavobacterium sp. LB3P122]|uniref:OmpA family protein n=1 Tax=Flavobacterium algoriphilum TaxID=3398738 RepID=UPI003A87E8F0